MPPDQNHRETQDHPSTGLLAMLLSSVERAPARIRLVQGQTHLDGATLLQRVQQRAAELHGAGITRGTPVALIYPNDIEFVVTYLAIAAIRAIVVPLNHEFRNEELAFYLEESGARAIITTPKLATRIGELASSQCPLLIPGEMTPPTASAPLPIEEEDCDFLYHYSSGSTGLPKRVIRTQSRCVIEARNFTGTCRIGPDDRIFNAIPMFHSHGMFNSMMAALYSGATLVIMENPQPFMLQRQRALQLVESEGITILPGIPFQFEALAKISTPADLSKVRICFSAGSKLPHKVYEDFLARYGIPIRQLYGSTETGSICINLSEDMASTCTAAGHPINNITVEIRDDDGNVLPVGEEGEVAICSPAMASGYYNLPELNAEVFRDGFFFPGDIGRLDENGILTITGRKRRFIEVVGHKVDPAVVEQALLENPAIREAVVLGIADAVTGKEQIKAVVVPSGEGDCNEESVRAYCRQRLASFEVPQRIEIRTHIDRDAAGKVQIKRLE